MVASRRVGRGGRLLLLGAALAAALVIAFLVSPALARGAVVPIVAGHENDPLPPPMSAETRRKQEKFKAVHGNGHLHGHALRPPPAEGLTALHIGQDWPLPPEQPGYGPWCAGPNERQFVLFFAHLPGAPPARYDLLAPEIAQAFRMTNVSFVHQALSTHGPIVRLRAYCGPVVDVEVTSHDPDEIWRQIRASYGTWYTKHVVIADLDPPPPAQRGQGYARLWHDSRGGVIGGPLNYNGAPNDTVAPRDSIIYYSDQYGLFHHGLMHEIVHTMGAVQLDAPNAKGDYHCADGIDVMCYDDQSTTTLYGHPAPQHSPYSDAFCVESQFRQVGGTKIPPLDCFRGYRQSGREPHDFFYASILSGGEYLKYHWNVARRYNGFIRREDGSP